MNEIEQLLKIIASFLAIVGLVAGYIIKFFPNLFHKNRIKIKKDYYNKIKNNPKFKEEIEAVSDDIDYLVRCKYYGNINPIKHKIIPLLKYYNVVNTIQQASASAKYLTLNQKIKQVTLDIKNSIGMIVFFLISTTLCFLGCLYYLTRKINSDFEYVFYLIFTLMFLLAGLFFFCVLLTTLEEIWNLRKTINKNNYYMQKIYRKVVKMNNSH